MVELRSRVQAWALHLAGAPVDQIATTTGLGVVDVAETITFRAPTARDGQGAAVELARVAELWRVVYPVALSGDIRAADLALRLSEKRMALAEIVEQEAAAADVGRSRPVREATEASIAAAVAAGTLDTAVAAGPLAALLGMADRMDRPGWPIVERGKFDNVTEPTYLRLCVQLGLTPVVPRGPGRPKKVEADDGEQPRGGRLAQLRSVRPGAQASA
jgi:hypothetical protein